MSNPSIKRVIEILLVDDSLGDVRLIVEAMKEGKLTNHISVVSDGVEAMAFLKKESIYVDSPRPDIILLDLNMPRKNGLEVLAEIKENPDLKTIPVIVLTTSQDEKDIRETYDLHANAFITKPIDLTTFLNVTKIIEDYWTNIVRLPQ